MCVEREIYIYIYIYIHTYVCKYAHIQTTTSPVSCEAFAWQLQNNTRGRTQADKGLLYALLPGLLLSVDVGLGFRGFKVQEALPQLVFTDWGAV